MTWRFEGHKDNGCAWAVANEGECGMGGVVEGFRDCTLCDLVGRGNVLIPSWLQQEATGLGGVGG